MDGREPMSMTAYYGRMHAFVSVLTGEMAMVRDLVACLEGQNPLRAFGWQAALDRARRRATRAVEGWRLLNETFEERVNVEAFERRIYGQNPTSAQKSARTAQGLTEMLVKLNGHIDGLDAYDAEDVRFISGLAGEMAQSISEEARASSFVADCLERGATQKTRQEGQHLPAAPPAIEDGESISTCFHAFVKARDDFRADLDG